MRWAWAITTISAGHCSGAEPLGGVGSAHSISVQVRLESGKLGVIMSAAKNGLFLHEEILLLVLREREGTTAGFSQYPYALGGAFLAELMEHGRIRLDRQGRGTRVEVIDGRPVGEPVLDECLERLSRARSQARIETWVARFAGLKGLKHRVAEGLCQRDILRADERQVLLFFRRRIYPEVDPRPEREILERLRRAVFGIESGGRRTWLLVSLAHQAGLLRIVFDRRTLRQCRDRIRQRIGEEPVGRAVHATVQAAAAAVCVTAVACG